MTSPRITVIACATVLEEMLPLMSPDMGCERLEFGLHLHPGKLREALQQAVDVASRQADTIILGYGLCAMAVVGLTATNCTLVVPRIDDCIAIFLGSRGAHQEQIQKAPGTYYLTKGWIEVGDTPFSEYQRVAEQYGKKRADRVMEVMLAHYTRLAFIKTGQREQERHREFTRNTAQQFNLRYEEIAGSNALVKKMLFGPWDDDFVVKPPGETISFSDFENMPTG